MLEENVLKPWHDGPHAVCVPCRRVGEKVDDDGTQKKHTKNIHTHMNSFAFIMNMNMNMNMKLTIALLFGFAFFCRSEIRRVAVTKVCIMGLCAWVVCLHVCVACCYKEFVNNNHTHIYLIFLNSYSAESGQTGAVGHGLFWECSPQETQDKGKDSNVRISQKEKKREHTHTHNVKTLTFNQYSNESFFFFFFPCKRMIKSWISKVMSSERVSRGFSMSSSRGASVSLKKKKKKRILTAQSRRFPYFGVLFFILLVLHQKKNLEILSLFFFRRAWYPTATHWAPSRLPTTRWMSLHRILWREEWVSIVLNTQSVREKERERECVCVCVWCVSECVCVCLRAYVCVRKREGPINNFFFLSS